MKGACNFKHITVLIFIASFFSCRPNLDKYKQRQKTMYGSMRISMVKTEWLPYEFSGKTITDLDCMAERYFVTENKPSNYSITLGNGVALPKRPKVPANDTTILIIKPVVINKCTLSIKGGIFDKPKSAYFIKPVVFTQCDFLEAGIFNYCDLSSVNFYSSATFTENNYNTSVRFIGDTFYRPFTFFNTNTLEHPPQFLNSCFEEGIRFNNRQLNSGSVPGFERAAGFSRDLIFNWCTLKRKVDLSNCRFDSNATLVLEETFLPDTLDLSNARLNKTVDLTRAFPNLALRKCEINLLNTDISLIKMQYGNFHLYIPDSIASDPLSKDIVSRTYEALLSNFKSNSFMDSFEQLDIEYKLWQSRYRLPLKISYLWWRFGYAKWLVVLWTLFILVIFSLYNYTRYMALQRVYSIPKLQWSNIKFTPNIYINTFKKYFATLLYTGLIFFRLSIDFKNMNFNPMQLVAVIIFQYSTGLICTGFLLNWILNG